MTTTATTEIPAERIKPGVAVQRVNAYNRYGEFTRQIRYYGTVEQARAFAALQDLHDTDPGWQDLVDILHGRA